MSPAVWWKQSLCGTSSGTLRPCTSLRTSWTTSLRSDSFERPERIREEHVHVSKARRAISKAANRTCLLDRDPGSRSRLRGRQVRAAAVMRARLRPSRESGMVQDGGVVELEGEGVEWLLGRGPWPLHPIAGCRDKNVRTTYELKPLYLKTTSRT
ncbi:hypothetical protein T484DRAFT_1753104 [Baffinella frigidus]|nr:hypothetical protein T484DRAFT_1753104 [Cryptophyta sp. CCMP2293]